MSLFDKIKSALRKEPMPSPDPSPHFTITKQADGSYRWSAIWSNKYRDQDNPPEILSEAAHLDFVKAVDTNEWPQPELWLWHIPGTRFGTTELIAYDLDNGFNIAAGLVDKGKERIAEIILELPVNELAVSHGMPIVEIERDPADSSVITRYRTKEISLLPLEAAANKLTSFELLGGSNMKLEPKGSEEKLEEFLGKDKADEVAEACNLKGQEAVESGLEFKDAEEAEDEVVEETVEETEVVEETVEVVEDEKSADPITREEVTEAMQTLAGMILNEVKSLNAQTQAALTTAITEFKSELEAERKAAEAANWTPAVTLKEMIAGSAIGDQSTYIDGRTKEARDKPKEAQENAKPILVDDPAMNDVITTIINGDFGRNA